MKKFLFALMILILAICAGCGGENYKNISHDDVRKIISDNPDAIILDVRTPEEYLPKHITDALLLPLEEIKSGNFYNIPDKNAAILIYCRTGRRSQEAAQILVENGYKNVYNMGGIVDWKGAVEGTDVDGYKHITQDEAREILANNSAAVLVDCRFPKDYEQKHIVGAVFVPLEAVIAGNLENLPDKDAPIITYCGDGNRARKTAKALVKKGFTNVYEMGGIRAWTGETENS